MKTVHKFKLNSDGELNRIALREGYRVIKSDFIVSEKAVFIWVEQPLNVTAGEVTGYFRVVRSGQPIPPAYRHVDTALDEFTPEAYHVYEVPEELAQKELNEDAA
ncbi:MAG: hypothetical protein D6758_06515 [Gammaproteobacteria bacterium]|nr:MAG: hypothetical protein D6758_06515 [Gammaproteobacteria bacterium]